MVKNPPEMLGDPGLIPGSGRSPGRGRGNPLQYFCPENPMDREAWCVQSMGSQKVGLKDEHTHPTPGEGVGNT